MEPCLLVFDTVRLKALPVRRLPDGANLQHRLRAVQTPAHSTALHAVLHEMAARSLDNARRNGIALPQVLVVTHPVDVVLEVATDDGDLPLPRYRAVV